MHILKVVLSCILSIAILSVGSAAAFASVHTRCLMPQKAVPPQTMPHMDMQSANVEDQTSTAHMDCMKVEKEKPSHSPSCASEKDCIMYYTHLAHAATVGGNIQLKPLFTYKIQQFIYPDRFLTSSEPFSVWRPPRML